MDERHRSELTKIAAPAEVLFDRAMKYYTTFQVGGNVNVICFPRDGEQLKTIISYLTQKDIPYLSVGKGSNLLIRDGGINGAVIILKGVLAEIRRESEHSYSITAGAGLPLSELLTYCRRNGLGGAEFLAGIPGTLGGAVAMNAGAYGKEIKDLVREVRIVTPQGKTETLDLSELNFSYRKLSLKKGSILKYIELNFKEERHETISRNISDFLRHRKQNQPLEYPSGGSVFKNPPNNYAGRLIEDAGLKGKRIGNAMISEKHANFIVNTGNAKAADILALMEMIKRSVKGRTGIELEPEIRVEGTD